MVISEITWSDLTPFISGVFGLSGALIGGLVTVLVNKQNRKGEVDSWLRREKLEIYNEILKFFREQSEFAGDDRYETDEPSYHNQVADLLTRAQLLSPPKVIDSIENCALVLLDYSHARNGSEKASYLKSFRSANDEMRKLLLADLKLN